MTKRTTRTTRFAMLLAAAALVVAACGDGDDTAEEQVAEEQVAEEQAAEEPAAEEPAAEEPAAEEPAAEEPAAEEQAAEEQAAEEPAAEEPADPAALAPYDPSAPAGEAFPGDAITCFPNPFDAELFLMVSDNMQSSTESRDGEYITAISDGDPQKLVDQSQTMLDRGCAAMLLTPIEEEATTPIAEQAVADGVLVVGVFRPQSHTQVVEDQYAIGYSQGLAAVKWIEETQGGVAEVAYFNEDMSASIRPRHDGVLDALATGGDGIEIVSDVQIELTTEAGLNAMNTILQAHPDVNVVMGGSGVIGGAYAAFDAAGRGNDPNVYISSIAGGNDALDLIATGESSYKATFGEPWSMWSYALGHYAMDWIEGKPVPRIITAPGGLVEISTPEAALAFKADMGDPAATWADEEKRDTYIAMYGNISYETRDTYWRSPVTVVPSQQ